MSKRTRRILVTLAVSIFAGLIISVVFYGKTRPNRLASTNTTAPVAELASVQTPASSTGDGATTAPGEQPATTSPATSPASATQPSIVAAAEPTTLQGLRAVATGNDITPRDQPATTLGSLDRARPRCMCNSRASARASSASSFPISGSPPWRIARRSGT